MDVSIYLGFLRKYYRLIILGTVLSGLVALLVTFFLPPVYEAEAQLAIVKSGAVVSFDPKYATISELDANNIDQTIRRKSLGTLGKSAALANSVIDKLGDRLSTTDRTFDHLLNQVDVSIDGDIVRIKVKTDNAQTSALIANSWAELYRDQVNQVYGEDTLTASDLRDQSDITKHDYDVKERALIDYLANNPIDQLTRQIAQKQQTLADLVTLQNKLNRLLGDATALKGKLASGTITNGRADELAALLLESSAFSTWSTLPVDLQIPINQLSAGVSTADQLRSLDVLISALEERRSLVTAEAGGTLQQEINTLQAQLEQANTQKRDLTRARDVISSTLTTLSNKLAEVQIASLAKTSVVRIAVSAVPPDRASTNRLPIVLLAFMVGFMATAATALVYEIVGDKVGTAEQVRQWLGLSVLASIPDWGKHTSLAVAEARIQAVFRLLRFRLNLGDQADILLITSAQALEDECRVARNLATSYSQTGKKVTLIQLTSQSPAFITGSVARNDSAAAESAQDYSPTPKQLPAFVDGLRTFENEMHDLDPEAFTRLLKQVKSTSDLVLLNAPGILSSTDALLAAQNAAVGLFVVQADRSTRTELLQAKEALQANGTKILGVVLTPSHARRYGHTNRGHAPLATVRPASRNGSGQVEIAEGADHS